MILLGGLECDNIVYLIVDIELHRLWIQTIRIKNIELWFFKLWNSDK